MSSKRPILRVVKPTSVDDLPHEKPKVLTREDRLIKYLKEHPRSQMKNIYSAMKIDEGSCRRIMRRAITQKKVKMTRCECKVSNFYDAV